MFMLQLAIATGWSLEYIENLPVSTFHEFKALNLLRPFNGRAEQEIMAFHATLQYNLNVKKGDQKSTQELFPFLTTDTPEFLEDEVVLKARRIKKTIAGQPPTVQVTSQKQFNEKVHEQIDMELREVHPDKYRIDELRKLLFEENVNGEENC